MGLFGVDQKPATITAKATIAAINAITPPIWIDILVLSVSSMAYVIKFL